MEFPVSEVLGTIALKDTSYAWGPKMTPLLRFVPYLCWSTHRICRTWFRRTFSENLLKRTWVQIYVFLGRYQVCLILCSKAAKIILSLSSIWVFFCTHHVNDENKYGWIKTTRVENDFSMFKGGFKYLDSMCTTYEKSGTNFFDRGSIFQKSEMYDQIFERCCSCKVIGQNVSRGGGSDFCIITS